MNQSPLISEFVNAWYLGDTASKKDASYFNGIEFTTNEKIRLYRTTNTPCFKYGQSWALDPESLDWAGGEIGKNIYYIDIEPTDVYDAFNNYLDCIIEVIVPNVKKKYKVHKLKINDQIKVLPYECNRVVRE